MLLATLMTIESQSKTKVAELERLLSQIALGDREALAQLYRHSHTAVYATALSLLKNAHDAQDVTHDVFVRVWDCASQYRSQGTPMAWLLTVTKNLARMKLRDHGRHLTMDDEQWNAIPADAPALSPEDRHLLQDALGSLSDEERRVVLLHAVSGMKHREIAEVFEMPLATVLSKYHRALKKLKGFMKGDDPQ
ncbi:MAG: RNA polymerase sigma factor [Clostridia bacterium]|nr:RNA polymerase sigma factor [Clostridia bacterium]